MVANHWKALKCRSNEVLMSPRKSQSRKLLLLGRTVPIWNKLPTTLRGSSTTNGTVFTLAYAHPIIRLNLLRTPVHPYALLALGICDLFRSID